MHIDDIESVRQFVEQEVGMIKSEVTNLEQTQLAYIIDKFDPQKVKFKEFLNHRVYALPDGTATSNPLTETGLVIPTTVSVTADTTYRELYESLFKNYDFPLASLLEGKCLRFCPDGFATVNGLCKPCESPCATCRTDVGKCLSCR